MRIAVSGLHRANIGQIVTIDTVDDITNDESVVMGTIEAIERGPDKMVLTVGGQEFEFGFAETVDIVRSEVLNKLMRKDEEPKALTEESFNSALEDSVQPGAELRSVLEEIIRETLTEVVQAELADLYATSH